MGRLTYRTEMGVSIDKNEDCSTMSICWACDIEAKNCNYLNDALEKLATYEDAEEQGLLLKLPCKVGDTVYQIMIVGLDKDKNLIYKVFEAKVIQYILDSYTLCFGTVTVDHYRCKNNMTAAEFGKTVFLTKEEAEAALERMNDGN